MTRSTARFIDGPLAGKSCSPLVCPIMLRGTLKADGSAGFLYGNDAAPDESVWVYMMKGRPTSGFWDGRDEKTGRHVGGTFAKYRLLEPQPAPAAIATDAAWKVWCAEQEARLRAEYERSV